MKKKISNIRIELNCYEFNSENIQLTELICEQIANFCSEKIKEINPSFKVNVKINKDYLYEKEPTDKPW